MPTATAPDHAVRRLPVVEYEVVWIWSHEDRDTRPRVDTVRASTAQRAMRKVIKDLAAEYADRPAIIAVAPTGRD